MHHDEIIKQQLEDEKLLAAINRTPDRGVYTIDVGNASEEVAIEAVRKLKAKYRGMFK